MPDAEAKPQQAVTAPDIDSESSKRAKVRRRLLILAFLVLYFGWNVWMLLTHKEPHRMPILLWIGVDLAAGAFFVPVIIWHDHKWPPQ